MPGVIIVGTQWGDEGKGKIVDFLAKNAAAVVRYQGGNNAGHTVIVDGQTYKLHLVPSGVLTPGVVSVLANGVVVDLPSLVDELEKLKEMGIDTSNFFLSNTAHLILDYHRERDAEKEKGSTKIGTTLRGIGPAYQDKIQRCGIRVCDFSYDEFGKKLRKIVGNEFKKWNPIFIKNRDAWEKLANQIVDTSKLINDFLDDDKLVLFEGAQGTFLDIDHGTYPYVTSSSPVAGGACTGSGVGPTKIRAVLGVTKAYTTRVGYGPFVTELTDSVGEKLQSQGHEVGTTTGRKRRCGWLDGVMLRYAVRVNGLTSLAVTKLDVLDDFDEIKICTAYKIGPNIVKEFPTDPVQLSIATPIYETFSGWKVSTKETRSYSRLPREAIEYLAAIRMIANVPITMISVGADRESTFTTANSQW